MEESKSNQQLNYISFDAKIDIGFWTKLTQKKVDEYMLDTTTQNILGRYKINSYKESSSILNLNLFSFNNEQMKESLLSGPIEIKVPGNMHLTNTTEEFHSYNLEEDEQTYFQKIMEELQKIYDAYKKKEEIDYQTQEFLKFLFVTFCDIKYHLYYYKFAVPAINLKNLNIIKSNSVAKELTETKQQQLENSLRTKLFEFKDQRINPYFFVEYKPDQEIFKFLTFVEFLSEFQQKNQNLHILFIDAFNQPTKYNSYINNILAMFPILKSQEALAQSQISVIFLKDQLIYNQTKCVNFNNSYIFEFNIENIEIDKKADSDKISAIQDIASIKMKQIDLKQFLNKNSLAQQAVSLNIKLMKWRLLPELDNEMVANTKCLLFGAGTLGCSVARNLLSWGITQIDFIDYGKVSYSNPVRQSLFTFEDSANSLPKAEAAAKRLKEIYPEVDSTGYQISIPMPGHYVYGQEQVEKLLIDLDQIEQLVQDHDAIFLLTDTRESRWLPTLLANKYNKICMTVGLGFESFVIIRQGISSLAFDKEKHKTRAGCYFCNDIIAPTNSLADRTLDQQCTVTRPGLTHISSGYAIELFISLLHHPLQHGAPIYENEQTEESPLGILPQHIRGNIADFDMQLFSVGNFDNCVACSDYVLQEYLSKGKEFILQVINDPDYLQKVSKIEEQLASAEENIIIEFD